MTIWQCGLKDAEGTLRDVEAFLNGDVVVMETQPVENEKGA